MFKNYLVTAFNNLLKSKLHTMINITGLSVGLAACILIALYVLDETSYDRQWDDAERIFRINQMTNLSGDGFRTLAATALLAVPTFQRFFPGEIETGVRLMSFDSEFSRGEDRFEEAGVRVDPSFTDIFDLDVLAGSLTETLADPSNIAFSSEVAESFFGLTDNFEALLNETVTVTLFGISRDYRVRAIYREPGNSILDIPTLALLDDSVFPPQMMNWGTLTVES